MPERVESLSTAPRISSTCADASIRSPNELPSVVAISTR
jgi:hypothetical protein